MSNSSQIDFSGLILSFASAALSYMGVPVDENMKTGKNLVLARQNIEIIELLKLKTKGNLTADEERLLSEVLTDLKLKYGHYSKD
jgi:hypothetical protein